MSEKITHFVKGTFAFREPPNGGGVELLCADEWTAARKIIGNSFAVFMVADIYDEETDSIVGAEIVQAAVIAMEPGPNRPAPEWIELPRGPIDDLMDVKIPGPSPLCDICLLQPATRYNMGLGGRIRVCDDCNEDRPDNYTDDGPILSAAEIEARQ